MVTQYEIVWVNLDPTIGSEIKKTRSCVIISPTISNQLLNTVIVAPLTSTLRNLPMRLQITLNDKKGDICLDQIRCIDKKRILKKEGSLSNQYIESLKKLIQEFLVD